ncbi:hypothetical protein P4493_04380 [Bacillus thuringiensis]|jgi:hypothetical protein|uniref:Uncharacterized protein n=3 Tax=Bacillus thuringiensis TaxID=1428 RepID=A0A0B5NBW8_BACTU|nr:MULTISPECIES: hypothetical protein [Bacillus]MEC2534471.1 hypothetical protein [Bacillus cereus]MED1153772.1 hypothetical protein [Bacillus paranthracis]OUB09365.1 hypothetical protein BK708_33110 [Bacillus thuringiensis serovar yunnanensis]AFQ30085.1 hypothetical protein BTF1_29922 [Bacillus thuringiensis HD-789]AJG73895.1 hypothetical protein BF38_5886 [Bacillus thuringiensis]
MIFGSFADNFWGYVVPACITYAGVNNKDFVFKDEKYSKGMLKREWVFVLMPYINMVGALFVTCMMVLRIIFWFMKGFLDNDKD